MSAIFLLFFMLGESSWEFKSLQRTAVRASDASLSRFRWELSPSYDSEQGSFSHHVSARFFIDPHLLLDGRRPKPVRHDEGFDSEIRGLFVEYSALPWKLRVGVQEVVWGETLNYFSADFLHPKDFRDGFTNSLAWSRRPQGGIWISRSDELWSLEWVYFPVARQHRAARYGSEFEIPRTRAETYGLSPGRAESLWDFSEPAVAANFGLKFDPFQLHAILGWIRDPQAFLTVDGALPRYRSSPISVFGVTLSSVWEDFLFRAESQMFYDRHLNQLTGTGVSAFPVTEFNQVGSLEYTGVADLWLSLTGTWMQRRGCQAGQILECRSFYEGAHLIWAQLPWDLEFESSLWAEVQDQSFWTSAKLRRPMGSRSKIQIALETFAGTRGGSSLFSDWRNRDQVVFEWESIF